jgi:hypothetical protein
MSANLEFLGANDRPALIAFSTPDWLDTVKTALTELGHKVHTAATHSDFAVRYSQARYQVVIVEELFGANSPEENLTLKGLQKMGMTQRRHSTILLVGNSFQTFAPMEAFQRSVHAVVNSSELFMLKQLVEKAVAENDSFLRNYRDVQARVFSGAAKP